MDFIMPGVKVPLEVLTGFNFFYGQKYDNRWAAVENQIVRVPLFKSIKGIIDPQATDPDVADLALGKQPNVIVVDKGQARREAWESIILGSATRKLYNIGGAQERGRQERGEIGTYESAKARLLKNSKDAGMAPPSKEVLDDLRWETELHRLTPDSPKQKHKFSTWLRISIELYNKKTGSNVDAEDVVRGSGTELGAKKNYETYRDYLYPDLKKWRSVMDKILNARLGEQRASP